MLFIVLYTLQTSVGAKTEAAATEPSTDARLRAVRTGDTVYQMPTYTTKAQWETRKADLRRHILVSAGLWPTPPSTPLNPHIFGRITRDGYTVERVYFESFPGFYVTGNLYRPTDGKPRHPGVLCPHGHWEQGRLADGELGSTPARCINLARQGYVAFSYDMVGYNDSLQLTHQTDGPREQLWGISLLGIQLMNSIRSIEFLRSLPDVDPDRIACTGESGGGTQTFLLTAVDDRVKVSAPVNMISAHFQGGCLCENSPGLRVDTFNVEIAAMMAPRPMLMVSATGDWTADTPRVEYPAVRSVFALYGAEDALAQKQIDAPHNYNKASREAVYAWFARWLQGAPPDAAPKEQPYKMEPVQDLRVFPDGKLPEGTATGAAVIESMIAAAKQNLEALRPRSHADLARLRELIGEGLKHTLCVAAPSPSQVACQMHEEVRGPRFTATRLVIWRPSVGDRIPGALYRPTPGRRVTSATLLIDPSTPCGASGGDLASPSPMVAALLRRGHTVLCIDPFLTGSARPADWQGRPQARFFLTFNRSDTAERVQDILTALAYLKGTIGDREPNLVGQGEAGIWCLLAAALRPGLRRVAVDARGIDTSNDESFLGDLFVPGLRRVGDVRMAAALCAPSALMIHNTQGRFGAQWAEEAYLAAGTPHQLRIENRLHTPESVADWVR